MQSEENARSAPNLDTLSDESLVLLATAEDSAAAAQALLLRYYGWCHARIGAWARSRKLTLTDVEDAKQDAVFALFRAMVRYKERPLTDPTRCSFRTFLYRVLRDRFADFCKHHRRVESGYDRSVRFHPEGARGRPGSGARMLDLLDRNESGDPIALAERNELKASVQAALNRLSATERDIAAGVMAGKQLRTIASELDCSYDAVKRRWREVRRDLAELLGPSWYVPRPMAAQPAESCPQLWEQLLAQP